MSFYVLQQVNKESYDRIARSYFNFIANTTDPNKEPVTVFSPLAEKMLEELELIREISKELQFKKEEEDRKALQEAEQSKNTEENATEENSEAKELDNQEVELAEVNKE